MLYKAKGVYISSHQLVYKYFIQLDEESWLWEKKCVISSYKGRIQNLQENLEII